MRPKTTLLVSNQCRRQFNLVTFSLPINCRCEKTATKPLAMADESIWLIDNFGNILLGLIQLNWEEILYLGSSSKVGDDASLLSPNLASNY